LQYQQLTKVEVMQRSSSRLSRPLSPPVVVSKSLRISNVAGSVLVPPSITQLVLTTNTECKMQ